MHWCIYPLFLSSIVYLHRLYCAVYKAHPHFCAVCTIHRIITPMACDHYTCVWCTSLFPLKNLGQKNCIIHGKTQVIFFHMREWVHVGLSVAISRTLNRDFLSIPHCVTSPRQDKFQKWVCSLECDPRLLFADTLQTVSQKFCTTDASDSFSLSLACRGWPADAASGAGLKLALSLHAHAPVWAQAPPSVIWLPPLARLLVSSSLWSPGRPVSHPVPKPRSPVWHSSMIPNPLFFFFHFILFFYFSLFQWQLTFSIILY